MKLHLGDLAMTSPAFEHGGLIPTRHTAEGEDTSPALEWVNVPEGTQELAVICHDPDAPLTHGFTHWVLYGLPPDAGPLPEHVPADALLSSGARQGLNDFGNVGYGGPCPPRGTHRYVFTLYAHAADPDLAPGATVTALHAAVEGHVLATARLVGTYTR